MFPKGKECLGGSAFQRAHFPRTSATGLGYLCFLSASLLFLPGCNNLGIPVAMEKLEGPATTITFLGIEIDSITHELRLSDSNLPHSKTNYEPGANDENAQNAKCYRWLGNYPLQPRLSIIPAGRLFLRCIIDLSTTAKCLHYHITLNKEAQADIQWWISFLPSWNGTANFLEQEWTDADSLQLYTDANSLQLCTDASGDA